MTVEEIEIIVTAKVEEALKTFQKFLPAIKQTMKQSQEAFSKVDMKEFNKKVQQAVNFTKKKVQDLKKSSENNEIAIKVTNKDAQKQISQIQKQIDSLQEKINARQMKLNIILPRLDKIANIEEVEYQGVVTAKGVSQKNKITNNINNSKEFQRLSAQEEKLVDEIRVYSRYLDEAKSKMSQLEQETNKTSTTQNKLSSFFGTFKKKIEQTKPSITSMKNSFSGMPKVTQNITNNIKNIGNGLKNGLGNILKYTGALLSLRGIYFTLSSCAQSWLSSQNAGAKQLSANIDYMKYAMGSTFAPVIQYVTGLIYQLMKAIQSVAYALTGVNIFAKASASSYASMAGSAKKAKEETKQLAGVHNEINNISDNNSDSGSSGGTTGPSFDLSQMSNTPNSIIDAIKNGNWYEVGATIGEKLNEAMDNIPWDKIQSTAKNIGTNIAQFLNGFIETTNWNDLGNTFAQGLNTIIYFGYNFVTNFDWKQFGKAIGDAINGFFNNVDWAVAAKTLSEGIKGILDTISTTLETIDWQQMARDVEEYVQNIDWSGVVSAIFRGIGAALGGLALFLGTLISDAFTGIGKYFDDKIEECGGNIVLGILKGIGDAVIGIGQWIYDNIFKPFIDGFKSAFGIHSPSTVMEEQGKFIIEGLKNGLTGIWEKVAGIFEGFSKNVKDKFKEIKEKVEDTWEKVKSKTKEKWEEIKGNVTDTWKNIKDSAKEKFDNIKSKVTDTWNNIKNDPNKVGMATAISNTFSSIKEKVREKFDNIKTKVTDSWNNIKNDKNLSSMSDTIKNTFSNLSSKSSDWGKDLVSNMASGIKNNIHKVTSAVNSVAEKIKNFLHFTEPDEGPLSNFHTYMPDMIDLMVNGIKTNTSKVKNEIENLAGTMSYTINTEAVTNIPSTNANINPINTRSSNSLFSMLNDIMAYKEGNNNDRPIYLTVNVGNTKIGQILLDNLRDMKRQTGKDIEAIIGD